MRQVIHAGRPGIEWPGGAESPGSAWRLVEAACPGVELLGRYGGEWYGVRIREAHLAAIAAEVARCAAAGADVYAGEYDLSGHRLGYSGTERVVSLGLAEGSPDALGPEAYQGQWQGPPSVAAQIAYAMDRLGAAHAALAVVHDHGPLPRSLWTPRQR